MTDTTPALTGQRTEFPDLATLASSVATEGIMDVFRKTEDKSYQRSARETLEQLRKDLKVKRDVSGAKPIKLGAMASFLDIQGTVLSSDKIMREYEALLTLARVVFRNYNAAMVKMVDQIADGLIAPTIKDHRPGFIQTWKKDNPGVHLLGMEQFLKTSMKSRHTGTACKSTNWMLSNVALIDFHAPLKGESEMTQAAVGLELRLGGKSVSSRMFTPLNKTQVAHVVELSTHFDEDFNHFCKEFEKASLTCRRKLRDRIEALGDKYPNWKKLGVNDEIHRIFAYGYTASHFAADGDRDLGAFFDRLCLVLIVMVKYAEISMGRMASSLPTADAASK